jgi:outer membrane protein TolC
VSAHAPVRTARATAPLDPANGSHLGALTLADVLDLALTNSPITRASWAQSRAAAATVGVARGRYLPTISGDVTGGPARVLSANPARVPAERSVITPSLSLQYLLYDFGGRAGSNAAAREALYAADFSHNATLQNVVLQAEQAYFSYQAGLGLVTAARGAVETARANLTAAEKRHDTGLATIADVLQGRTALAQSELTLQDADANAQAARASVALAMGIDANAPFVVAPDTSATPLRALAANVDSLIAHAVRDRPDLAAAEALARESEAQIRVARAARFPGLALGAATGRSFSSNDALTGRTYGLTFGLSVPLFSGQTREYAVVAASEDAAAAAARAERARLETVAQVFTSYHALRTATQRVSTAAELLASATQSEEVARGRYAEGAGSILDLLTAQTALADARAQSVLARWQWYASLAQLSRDTGVLGPHGETRLPLTLDPSGTNR